MRVFALLNALAFTVVLVAAVQDVDQSAELADVGDLDQDLGIADLDALGLSDNDMEEMGDSNEADWLRWGGRRRFFRRPWAGRPFWGPRRRRWGWRRARPWVRPSVAVSVGGGDGSQPGGAAPAEEPKADGDAEAPAAGAAEDAAAPAEAPADDAAAAPAEGDAAEAS